MSKKLAHQRYDGPFWVHTVAREGERDIYGMLNGKPYAEAAVACERLRPSPENMGGDSGTMRRLQPIVDVTMAKARAEQEAADSDTDVHSMASEDQAEGLLHVESILDSRPARLRSGRHVIEYLVHWRDGKEQDSWELEEELQCSRKILDYQEAQREARQPAPVGIAAPPIPPVVAVPPRANEAAEAGTVVRPTRRSSRKRVRSRKHLAAAMMPYGKRRRHPPAWSAADRWSDESNTED